MIIHVEACDLCGRVYDSRDKSLHSRRGFFSRLDSVSCRIVAYSGVELNGTQWCPECRAEVGCALNLAMAERRNINVPKEVLS